MLLTDKTPYLVCVFFTFLVTVKGKSKSTESTQSTTKQKETKSRDHIDDILRLRFPEKDPVLDFLPQLIAELKKIYAEDIKPIEDDYKFTHFKETGLSAISDAELEAKPMILLLGPWSTGKSTIINYLVGTDDQHQLPTGAEHVTTDFTVVMHGKTYRKIQGSLLVADRSKPFGDLEKYGRSFTQKLSGIQMPSKLLERVTFVDTPGVTENRKQQQRGYPFEEVSDWFIKQADLILVVFDPTKLEIGNELEIIFRALKGQESKIRIVFNKADSLETHELIRVYGDLFWSLAPLINVIEPPKVYVGSFWNQPFKSGTYQEFFEKEEKSLLYDINNVIIESTMSKVAKIRERAKAARIHALVVDRYLSAFLERKPNLVWNSLFGGEEQLWQDIKLHPKKYSIIQSVISHKNVSVYDISDPKFYQRFFEIHDIKSFKELYTRNSLLNRWTPLDTSNIEAAIFGELPSLLDSLIAFTQKQCNKTGQCAGDQENIWTKS